MVLYCRNQDDKIVEIVFEDETWALKMLLWEMRTQIRLNFPLLAEMLFCYHFELQTDRAPLKSLESEIERHRAGKSNSDCQKLN